MKKYTLMLLILVAACLALTACTPETSLETDTTETPTTQEITTELPAEPPTAAVHHPCGQGCSWCRGHWVMKSSVRVSDTVWESFPCYLQHCLPFMTFVLVFQNFPLASCQTTVANIKLIFLCSVGHEINNQPRNSQSYHRHYRYNTILCHGIGKRRSSNFYMGCNSAQD